MMGILGPYSPFLVGGGWSMGSRSVVVMITIVCVSTQCGSFFFCQDLTQMSYDFGKKKKFQKRASLTVSDDVLPVMFGSQKGNGSEKRGKK